MPMGPESGERSGVRSRACVPDARRVLAAEQAVGGHLAVTPVVELAGTGGRVLLKVDTVQPAGSFKVRGAVAVLCATPRRLVGW